MSCTIPPCTLLRRITRSNTTPSNNSRTQTTSATLATNGDTTQITPTRLRSGTRLTVDPITCRKYGWGLRTGASARGTSVGSGRRYKRLPRSKVEFIIPCKFRPGETDGPIGNIRASISDCKGGSTIDWTNAEPFLEVVVRNDLDIGPGTHSFAEASVALKRRFKDKVVVLAPHPNGTGRPTKLHFRGVVADHWRWDDPDCSEWKV